MKARNRLENRQLHVHGCGFAGSVLTLTPVRRPKRKKPSGLLTDRGL